MAERHPILIMIPGLGDAVDVYQVFARRWMRLGYEVQVVSFGWADTTAALDGKLQSFLEALDALGDNELYVIGVSAGGTAAINLLAARPERVRRVITICAPLDTMSSLRNPLLAESISRAKTQLAALPPDQRQRILSVYALYDQVVDPKLSAIAGVQHHRLLSIIHAPTIFVALMFYARSLNRFLRQRTA
jgi:pimeloyl-ACP methyl ester carboxylesterase